MLGYLFAQLVSKIFNLCGHDPPTSQTGRQTDGQTSCDLKTVLCSIVHRAVKQFDQIVCKSEHSLHYLLYLLIENSLSLANKLPRIFAKTNGFENSY